MVICVWWRIGMNHSPSIGYSLKSFIFKMRSCGWIFVLSLTFELQPMHRRISPCRKVTANGSCVSCMKIWRWLSGGSCVLSIAQLAAGPVPTKTDGVARTELVVKELDARCWVVWMSWASRLFKPFLLVDFWPLPLPLQAARTAAFNSPFDLADNVVLTIPRRVHTESHPFLRLSVFEDKIGCHVVE